MVEFVLELAGHRIHVAANYESTRQYCGKYLSTGDPALKVQITPADLAFERDKRRKEMQPEQALSDGFLERTAVQRKLAELLVEKGVIAFHGSVVAVDGQAYLFTATSGTGKSTHTRFWRETFGDRAVMVNDDKPFLQITEEGVLACGSPWNGKHGLGNNISVPLKAICILERGEENQIQPISAREAAPMLFQQSHRPIDPRKMPAYMELIDKLTKRTCFYRMRCTLNPDAARVAFEEMSKQRGGE